MTNLEAKLLRNIAENEYAPGNGAPPTAYADTGAVWSNCLNAGPEALAATSIPGVVASLVKKNLIYQQGKGKDAVVCLTEAGFAAYVAARESR